MQHGLRPLAYTLAELHFQRYKGFKKHNSINTHSSCQSLDNGTTCQRLYETHIRLKHSNNHLTRMLTANPLSTTPVTEMAKFTIHNCTDCSPLIYYLDHKNNIDSLLCSCGKIETSLHFLLECNQYDELRQVILDEVSRYCLPSLHSLLYGNNGMTSYSKPFKDTL